MSLQLTERRPQSRERWLQITERRLQSRRKKAEVNRRVVGYEQKGVSLNKERKSGLIGLISTEIRLL